MVTADLLFKRGVKLRIIAVYIPSNDAKRKKATEKAVLKELTEARKAQMSVILMGDFNGVMNFRKDG